MIGSPRSRPGRGVCRVCRIRGPGGGRAQAGRGRAGLRDGCQLRVQRPLSPCCLRPCWRRDPMLPKLSGAQEKPAVQVFMGNLSKGTRRRKSFLVRGQQWQEGGVARAPGRWSKVRPPGEAGRVSVLQPLHGADWEGLWPESAQPRGGCRAHDVGVPRVLGSRGHGPSCHRGTGPRESGLVLQLLHFLGKPVISLPARLPLAQGPGFSGPDCVIGIY